MRARAAVRRPHLWTSVAARGRRRGRGRESSHPRPLRRPPSTSHDARGDRWKELIACAERRPAAELTTAFEFSTVARMNNGTALSPRALRLRAIFLPAVVVLTVWLLNVVALRTHVGPREAGFWMLIFIAASV